MTNVDARGSAREQNRAAWTRRGALAEVALPGAVALAIIARALLFYAGHDATATLLVGAMGACLVLGLGELWLRSRRGLALADELAGLAAREAWDERELERLSPALQQLLRARIEHAPAALRGDSITPYLVGLLVMLGLLGTLLGLFETLSGAGQALAGSASVDALRSGLSGPMRGLTRSFGCSAAGVGASAMLGLAAALVRRREGRVLAAVQACVQGPLRELSPLRRQTSALQQLANQGDALPKAAAVLELAAERLGGLAERWETAHRAATAAQHKALEQALQGLRGELGRAAQDVGRTLQASLAGQLEKLLASTGSALSEHVAKTARASEQDALARREGDAALREKLQQELAGLRAALEQNIGRQGELISAQTSALAASTQQLEQLAASAGRQLDGLGDGVGKRLEQVADSVGVQLGQMSEWLSRKLEQLSGDVGQQLLQATSGAGEQLSQLGEGLGQQLTQLTGNISTQLAQVTGSIGTQLTQVTGNIDAQLAQLSGGVGEQLTRLTDGVGRELEARLSLSAELTERVQGAQALLTQSAGSFDQALTRQAQAVDALVGHGREQLAQLQETASQSTLAAVERVVQLAQGQAERLAQFESELQRVQQGHAQELSEQLGRHAAQLGSGLEGTGALVHEAADLLKATSVELSAVAESFAGSVERQRESAATWLETLGELEGAVERAGRGAAADALGDQLASTQEVFARQLQFQRELFEQLRSLRSPSHPSVHGERDVSA